MKFFKENIAFTLSLLITILIATLFFFQIKNDFFPDLVIQKRGETYTRDFVATAEKVEQGLVGFKGSIDSSHFFRLSLDEKIDFLLEELNGNATINGMMILDHSGRFSTMIKDQNTFLFASDSSSKIDNVIWYRVDKESKILNSWTMALGMELNMLSNKNKGFHNSIQLNTPLWSSSYRLFGSLNNNIANHISWNWRNTGELITCIVTLNEESFINRAHILYNKVYQSFLYNSNDRKISLHHTVNGDTINGKLDAYNTAAKSWEVTGKSIPGTFSFNYQNDLWWGQAVQVPAEGIHGLVISMSQKALFYSSIIDHLLELIIFLALLFFTLYLLFRSLRKKPQSLSDFTKSQTNDQHASELIKLGETSQLEFKSSFRYDYKQQVVNKDLESVIAKSIAAFSNASGGVLLIGVDDEGQILGLENDINTLKRKDIDFFENTLRTFLNKTFSVSFVTQNLKMKFPVVNEKAICRIDIIIGNEPVFVEINKKGTKSERFYLRSGNTSQEIISLREINDYIKGRFSSN